MAKQGMARPERSHEKKKPVDLPKNCANAAVRSALGDPAALVFCVSDPYRPDVSNVASASECTGLMQTVPQSEAELESYEDLSSMETPKKR